MSANVTFRRATAADYDDVMDINRHVYKGLDYLPARYNDYLKDPDRHMFVALADGRVVGFLMRYVTGEGTLSSPQGIRIHPNYIRRGIPDAFGLHVYLEVKDRYPNLCRSASTAVDGAGLRSMLSKKPYHRVVTSRHRLVFVFEEGALDGITSNPAFQQLQRTSFPDTQELSREEAMSLLAGESNWTKFIPEGLWIVDWEPFEPHRNNYQTILKKASVFVTRDEKTRNIRALSFFMMVAVPRGWRCQVDFYRVDGDNDPLLITAHVLAHMQKLHKIQDRKHVTYLALYPENYPGSACRDALQTQLSLTRGDPFYESPAVLMTYDDKDFLEANTKIQNKL